MAISGEIPAWPFTRSESCLRLTPSCLAASVTLSPKGSRQSCLTDRPGCGGFFMGIALSAPLLAQEFETFVAKALYHLRSVTYHLSNRPQERPAVLHGLPRFADVEPGSNIATRSEEQTSDLQSQMRHYTAVFFFKK